MTPPSIRLRITLWNTAAFAVVLLGFGLLVYWLLRQTHYEQVDARLRSQMNLLLNEESAHAFDRERVERKVSELSLRGDIVALMFDDKGPLLSQSKLFDGARELGPRHKPSLDGISDSLTVPALGHMRRLAASGQEPGDGCSIVLLAPLDHVDEEMAEVVKAILITVPITLGLAAALAYFLARKALSPVEQLRRRADAITAEHLDQRLPLGNPADELGLLAQTINAMIERLDRSFSEVRRFTADASHELRTPIAVIRSEAELGIDTANNVDEAKERLASILEECNRLTFITEQLLALSREDAGMTGRSLEPVQLAPMLTDVIGVMQPLASGRSLVIESSGDGDVVVRGDEQRLRQVFYNLLDNAIKYTPGGGKIEVSQRQQNGEVVVDVRDTGIGIPPTELRRVFDRFYRVNQGEGRGAAGTGLGLSIVQSIVAAHGGRVEVESKTGNGSVFRVSLPIANSAST
jgi:heavy metal sensor kinase